MESVRLDRWVYAVRLCKTRSLASSLIDKGKVKLNDESVKPAHQVKPGDVVSIKDGILFRTYLVLDLAEKRMGAKLAIDYYKETTPPENLERLKEIQNAKRSYIHYSKGRPTKKDRRNISKYLD